MFVSLVHSQSSSQRCRFYYTENDDGDGVDGNITKTQDIHLKYYMEYEKLLDGCVCDFSQCLIKCCPLGEIIQGELCTKVKAPLKYHFNVYNRMEKIGRSKFSLIYVNHSDCFSIGHSHTYLQEDASLYLEAEATYLSRTKFCWDVDEFRKPVQWECGFNHTEVDVQGNMARSSDIVYDLTLTVVRFLLSVLFGYILVVCRNAFFFVLKGI